MPQQPLTTLASAGGCAAKIGPGQLYSILDQVDFGNSDRPHSITRREDAGGFSLGTLNLLQSIDVIAPVSDDPYTFGGIAAAHSLSDIYAKGGEPITGLIILAFPPLAISNDTAAAVIQGATDMLATAGAQVLGGHTVASHDLLAGVAVTGLTPSILSNSTTNVGDAVILTKPVGVGIIISAQKLVNSGVAVHNFTRNLQSEAERWMLLLNTKAAVALRGLPISACTDVSGFGLIGHLFEMISQHSATILSEQVPLVGGAAELVSEGISSVGGDRNWHEWGTRCEFKSSGAQELLPLLFDPQTSGGLLISTPRSEVHRVLKALEAADVIGTVIAEIHERRPDVAQVQVV